MFWKQLQILFNIQQENVTSIKMAQMNTKQSCILKKKCFGIYYNVQKGIDFETEGIDAILNLICR